jgi:hypothetical protein
MSNKELIRRQLTEDRRLQAVVFGLLGDALRDAMDPKLSQASR